jgi:succinyl-diaminopimelate desuccinylase
MDTNRCVEFLRRLIQTPSLSGKEGDVAELVRREMESLGYDGVSIDEAGNVIGEITGRREAPAIMFNTHLDHVDVGEVTRWPFPPYGAQVSDGRIWGRGAVDAKGPLVAQVHGVGQLARATVRPPGDVFVTAVVQGESGGLGVRHLRRHLQAPFVVVGQPSHNEIRRGQRGRTEVIVHVRGRSAHASVPERGCNPLEILADFILRLKHLRMRQEDETGVSTVAPTFIRVDEEGPNVVPGEAWLTCDWRNVPGESAEDVRLALKQVAEDSLTDGAGVDVHLAECVARSYTGLPMRFPLYHPPFLLPAEHPAVREAERVLAQAFGTRPSSGIWPFTTDGGLFAEEGRIVIGFGPGDEMLSHTVHDAVEIAALERAAAGYQALALDWSAAAT